MEHKSELIHTTDDDGIYVQCSCGWECNIGFFASVYDAVFAWEVHIKEVSYD